MISSLAHFLGSALDEGECKQSRAQASRTRRRELSCQQGTQHQREPATKRIYLTSKSRWNPWVNRWISLHHSHDDSLDHRPGGTWFHGSLCVHGNDRHCQTPDWEETLINPHGERK